ncbi:MAG TPA: hypothetical protein VFB67_11365 [Candidatus Polarisedimenticolaceae bacterium]|nr:hypothetical protein [Candidatus Polarisedimenticolaceae bacterium]
MLLDARATYVTLIAWATAVLVYGLWRSLGAAARDPIRPSGPIVRRRIES